VVNVRRKAIPDAPLDVESGTEGLHGTLHREEAGCGTGFVSLRAYSCKGVAMRVPPALILERMIRELPSASGQAPPVKAAGADTFHELMESAARVKTAAGQADEAQRQKLAVLLELITIGMSRSVMDALSGSDGDGEPSLAGIPLPPADLGITGLSPGESKDERSRGMDDMPAKGIDLEGIVDKASATYGVDRRLIVSVIRAESGFDPKATSPKGAMGLMQLMPETARALGVKDAYDPEENVMAGTRFLKDLLERYEGDVEKALAAYNWGPGNLERNPGRLPRETRTYIARIMGDYLGESG